MPLQPGETKPKRKSHLIRKAKGGRYPSRFIFFDTETKDVDGKGKQQMILAFACYWEIVKTKNTEKVEWFDTTIQDALFTFITSKCRRHISLRVISANIWFDLRVSGILSRLKRAKWVCKRFFCRGHTFIAIFQRGNQRIEFINLQNYFNFPVDKIGESIGLPKLKINLDRCSQSDLKLYCKRDVEIVFKAIRSLYFFIKDSKLGSISYTLPSVSYSCYTHSFMPKSISVHTQEDILSLERKAYFGGRCECFKIGRFTGETFYKLDVNAMYPFVMKENHYPYKFEKVGYDLPPEVITNLVDKWLYIAEVELDTDKPVYPYRSKGKLIFPVGKFTTYVTNASLLHAIENNHVKKIKMCAAYKKSYLFNDFVNYFYNQRLKYRAEKNPAFAYICKLILNSLYGKFGQRNSVLISETESDTDKNFRELIWHVQQKKFYIHQIFYGLEQMILLQEEEGLNSMPAISAHVTDYARLYLWGLIEKAKISNCYYCDTDSLIVNGRGYKNLKSYLHKDTLGMVKVEGTCQDMEIRGAKNYTFGGKDKIKGIPRKAIKKNGQVYQYPRFPTAMSELRSGLKEDYRIEQVTKKLSGVYDKGIVMPSGRVRPHRL